MCVDLADLAMSLARVAAARALAQPAEPEISKPIEPAAAKAPASPHTATPLSPAGLSLRAPTLKSIDPALLFVRLAAIVRACMALETRLAAGIVPKPRVAAAPTRAEPPPPPAPQTQRAPEPSPAPRPSPPRHAAPVHPVAAAHRALGARPEFQLDLARALAPRATSPP